MKKKEMANPRDAYGETLVELGGKHRTIVVLDADLSKSTKTILFAKKYPDRLMIKEKNDIFILKKEILTLSR
jgi:transketolase